MDIEEYLETVQRSVEEHVFDGMNELREQLQNIANTKNLREVTPQKLNHAIEELKKKCKSHFEKNISKFNLYVLRNVFREDDSGNNGNPNNSSSSASITAGSSNTTSKVAMSEEEAEENAALQAELGEELSNLHQNYTLLYQDYSRMMTECQEMDALIKDMRATSFSVRLGLQDMDQQYDAQTLADATNLLNNYQQKLQQLRQEAEDLLRKLQSSYPQYVNSNNTAATTTTTTAVTAGDYNNGLQDNNSYHYFDNNNNNNNSHLLHQQQQMMLQDDDDDNPYFIDSPQQPFSSSNNNNNNSLIFNNNNNSSSSSLFRATNTPNINRITQSLQASSVNYNGNNNNNNNNSNSLLRK